MNRALASAVLGACLALAACAAPPAAPAPAQDSEAAASRQILVMLQMPAPHFQAGGAYDGNYAAAGLRAARRRAARELAREHHLRMVDDWPMPVIGVDCFVMERPAGMPTAALLEALARDPRVAWAQPVNLFHGMDGDPLYPVQPVASFWHLADLHRLSTGRGVRVAVVDSGVDARHPDLAGQVALQENFVDDGPAPPEPHGTAVAGIIAARAGNGAGIAGVAPDARLMALRACWQSPGQGARCSSFTLGKALDFAITHDARVINLSLAGPPDRLLEALVEAAAARGTAVVGAIDPAQPGGGFPASAAAVLAVAAQRPAQQAALAPARSGATPAVATQMPARQPAAAPGRPGAQQGALPGPAAGAAQGSAPGGGAFAAPGTDIPTCLPGGGWGFVSGNSYAAAHVTGLVALLLQLQPRASPAQLKRDIAQVRGQPGVAQTANHPPQPASIATIDACATIARAAGACACACPPAAAPQASLTH